MPSTLHNPKHPRAFYSKQHISITWALVRTTDSASEQDARCSACREALLYMEAVTAPLSLARNLWLKAVHCLTSW